MKRDLPPKKNLALRRSFLCAFSGIATCYLRERNFRIHLGVGLVALYLGYCFSLSRAEWVGLILTIALVLTCELVNSSIEHLTDYAADGQEHPLAGAAKDIAAGAVLLCSIAAVGVGITLFWKPDKLSDLLWEALARPMWPVLILAIAFFIVRFPDRVAKSKAEEEERKKKQFPPGY